MTGTKGIRKKLIILALAGDIAFWLANFAISRTRIAAEYRAALEISYYPMLLEALIGGLLIGICVGYFLLRFFNRIPATNPILKSVFLSMIALLFVTISIGNPKSFSETNNIWRYFIIGTAFNFTRILALGLAIGYVCKKKHWGIKSPVFNSKPA